MQYLRRWLGRLTVQERAAQALGANVDLGSHVEIAPFVMQAVRDVHALGFSVPERIKVSERHFVRFGPDADLIVAEFVPHLPVRSWVIVNPGASYWVALRANDVAAWQEPFLSGLWSTDHPLHPLYHEFGHAVHWAKDHAAFVRAETEGWPPNAEGAVEGFVSRYAISDPNEFVAEVFAGLIAGRRFERAVLDWYEHLGGRCHDHDSDALRHLCPLSSRSGKAKDDV